MNERFSRMAAYILVAIVALATYANSIVNGFALDDNYIIEYNARVHDLANQAGIWLTPYWPNFGELLGLYRPLVIFGYAVQWAVGDGSPIVFHANSILMHAAVSLLVLALLRRLATPGAALLGALVFAVHPLHTEVVANVVGQAEMIAAICVIAACILYVDRPKQEASVLRSLAIVALFLAGMLAKEGAIVLPGLLVALDFATGRVRPERASLKGWAITAQRPMFFLGAALAAYLTLRLHVLGSIGGGDAAPHLPFLREGHRFLSALRAWPEYARLLVFPVDLVSDYAPGVVLPVESLSPMVVLGAVLLLVTVTLAIATPWVREAGLPAAWFFIAVFPVSNLILPIGVLLAERILYLPSVALSIAVAFAAARFAANAERRQFRIASAIAAAALVAMATRSIVRNPDWKSTDAVWDAIVRDHPESYRSQSINGWRMLVAGNLELAKGYYELANRIWSVDAITQNNLAGVYLQLGQFDNAIATLELSRELSDLLSNTEQMLAYSYLATDRPRLALEALARGDRLGIEPVLSNSLRAQAWARLGRFEQAAAALRLVVAKPKGDTPDFRLLLARDLARAGYTHLAIAQIDTLELRTTAGTRIRRTVDRLRSAIAARCFIDPSSHSAAPDPAAPCQDPLASWPIVLPGGAQEVATPLQNATGPGLPGGAGADPGDSVTQ